MTDIVKTVHVSRREDGVRGMLAPELRDDLAAAGVHRLQVNVDDEHVAPAQLRTTEHASPIRAVVTAWTLDADAVTEVLRGVDDAVAGWRVEERTPLDPPDVADGQRADAFAQVAFLRRPDELTREEWIEQWIGSHTQVAIETQATFGYVQNEVTAPLTENADAIAAIVEELFPMAAMTDWHAFYGSAGDQEELDRRMRLMRESVDRFGARQGIEVVPTSRYVFDL